MCFSALAVLGLVAAALGTVCALPQITRLLRVGHADGLSYLSCVLGLLSSATWLTYGLLFADLSQIIANAIGLACAGLVVWLVARHQGLPLSRLACAALAWSAVCVAAYVVGGPTAVGVAATAVAVVRMGPQVRCVFTDSGVAALSPESLALSLASGTAWAIYGVCVSQVPLWLCSEIGLVLSAVVLARRCPPRVLVLGLHRGKWGPVGARAARPWAERYLPEHRAPAT